MAPKGPLLGFDPDDPAYIPVASARLLVGAIGICTILWIVVQGRMQEVELGLVLTRLVPGLGFRGTPEILIAALGMALGVGMLASVAPAVRASRLDPIEALRDK